MTDHAGPTGTWITRPDLSGAKRHALTAIVIATAFYGFIAVGVDEPVILAVAVLIPIFTAAAFWLQSLRLKNVVTVASSGLTVSTPENAMGDTIPWSSLVTARPAGESTVGIWDVIAAIALRDSRLTMDMGGPLIELSTRWYTWRMSCTDRDTLLAAIYARRPDLKNS